MNANDVQIGDWMFHVRNRIVSGFEAGGPVCVLEIYEHGAQTTDGFVRYEDLEPIPVTPEILEKNSFQKQAGEVWEYDIFSKDKSLASMIVWRRDYATPSLMIRSFVLQYGTYSRRDIKYIHELQHALRLCGIEKEIEL